MINNYIKYALRYLIKNKTFTLINILGLSVGLASFLLIINFVQYEQSYDGYIDDVEDVYRVNILRKNTGAKAAAISPPMAPTMKSDFPEIESYVRFRHANRVLVTIGEEEFYNTKVFYADSSFLDIFSFPVVSGIRDEALDRKNTAIVSKSTADKYFKDKDPIGQIIYIDQVPIEVTAVVGEPATPSHFEFEMLISFQTFEVPYGYPVTLESWGWASFPTYLKLRPNTDVANLQAQFGDFIARNMSEQSANALALELQPVSEIHLYSKDISERDGIPAKGDIQYVTILFSIALLIICLAIFNFTNLSTSLSLRRVKEVGVRKTLGAQRQMVFWQYFTESLVLTAVSFVLAVTCLEVFNDFFNQLFQVPIEITDHVIEYWYFALALTLIVGLAGGAYPVVFLSKYSPVKALKSRGVSHGKNFGLKTVLVGVQFLITIGLVAGSLVINDQMSFMRNKDLGFNKEQVIAMQVPGDVLSSKFQLAKQRLLSNPYVKSVSVSGNLFDGQNGSVPVVDQDNEEEPYRISLFGGHYDFAKTMDLKFVEGRDFSKEFANDSSGFILNEAAVKMFGWKESALGKQLRVNVWDGEVIGVVEDFHFASLHENISPVVIYIPSTYSEYIFVKTEAGNLVDITASLRKEWEVIFPESPFDYTFLDDHISKLYQSDQNFSKVVNTFSVLAIFLACMGLFGIIAYNIDTRRKEIGIRKVLGASISNVVIILSKQYLILIAAAALVGIPLSWYFLADWLNGFAYKISLSPIHFALAVSGTLLLAFLTMSLKTLAAANTNPTVTLKED